MTVTTSHIMNGLDVDKATETIDALKSDPDLARCEFRLSNKWLDGGHNHSMVGGFYGAKQEMQHASTFELDADEPYVIARTDKGANPVELPLDAIAACVTTSTVYHASVQGIEIQELESELEGDIDLRGFLGISDNVRKGYQNIRVNFKVKTQESEDLERLKALATFSPVFDVVTNGTKVDMNIERKQEASAWLIGASQGENHEYRQKRHGNPDHRRPERLPQRTGCYLGTCR